MMELTKQEFQNECLFSVTMSHVRSMLQNNLISQDEYFQMRDKMKQKYHPVSDGLISETDLQAAENRGWATFVDRVTIYGKDDIRFTLTSGAEVRA